MLSFNFLSILSIKRGNWFYWAERAETAERAEIKESPLFIYICSYPARNQRLAKMMVVRIPSLRHEISLFDSLSWRPTLVFIF
jgi:hypothetical protein